MALIDALVEFVLVFYYKKQAHVKHDLGFFNSTSNNKNDKKTREIETLF